MSHDNPDPGGRGLALAWSARHMALGGGVGLAFGLVGQSVVMWAGSTAEYVRQPSLGQRAAGVVVTAIGYAVVALVVGALGGVWRRSAMGRAATLAFSAALFAALFAFHVLGVAIRMSSGAYLTTGALEFAMNSREHFAHAIVHSYGYYGIVLLGVSLAFAVGVGAFLRRALLPLRHPRARARLIGLGSCASGAVCVVLLPLQNSSFVAGASMTTPELALLSSMDGAARAGSDVDGVLPVAPLGPPLSTEVLWRGAMPRPEAARGATGRHGRPNVLLMTLESIAISHLGYEGYARPTTPNLDRIAARSARFHRAYTTATHSNYAQMAILSSLFPRRGTTLDQYGRLDYPRFLTHDLFHELGYRTATISSQDETWQGMRRFQDTGTPTFFLHAADFKGRALDTGTERTVPDDETARFAIEWIEKAHGRPWQLYVNLQNTHFPYELPEGRERRFEPAEPTRSTFTYLGYPEAETPIVINRYDSALAYVDEQIGRIEQYLADSGQLRDTLWVITADHGEGFHDYGVVTHGRTVREVETRVPLLVSWPAGVVPGDFDEPVSHLDVMPTIAELVGAPVHPSWQGRSLAGVATGAEESPVGPAPGIFTNIQGMTFAEALVCWPNKLIVDHTHRQSALYDLERDPGELVDRSESEPETAAALARVLEAHMDAQLEYHADVSWARRHRYAPRLLPCPEIAPVLAP